jgi:hypothetical protein
MSAKRPSRRYIGFRYEPAQATRKDVSAAIEGAWRVVEQGARAPPPRLLVCQRGVGIVVVPTPLAPAARAALARGGTGGAVKTVSEVSSGTIAAVKRKMRVGRTPKARGT